VYWKRIITAALKETGYAKPRAIVPSFVTTLSNYGWQWRLHVRPSFQLTLICIGIGLGTYALIVAGEFTLKFFQVIGRDQDSKQQGIEDSIRQLARVLHPELSEKALTAIRNIEARIQKVDDLFSSEWPNPESVTTWTNVTASMLFRVLGQGSDWAISFLDGGASPLSDIQSTARGQTKILRQVAVLRDIIDEIKRQRVLVLGT
jgi:hypothetical protein